MSSFLFPAVTTRGLKLSPSPAGQIHDDLIAGLAEEPCVIERDQDVAALLEDPRKLRKGMGPRRRSS